jgi:hypothetical protein
MVQVGENGGVEQDDSWINGAGMAEEPIATVLFVEHRSYADGNALLCNISTDTYFGEQKAK